MKFVLGTLLVLMFTVTASADSVWTYTGNSVSGSSNVPMTNPCGCAIDGTVTLNAAGSAVAWDFTVDGLTLTNLNSHGQINDDLNGANPNRPFYTWRIVLSGPNGSQVASSFDGSTFEATDSAVAAGSLFMFEEGNPGAWTDAVATPEPGTGLLIAGGLLAVGTILSARDKMRFLMDRPAEN
jgi:hypothetical protein